MTGRPLTDAELAWVDTQVAKAPPVTDEQIRRTAAILAAIVVPGQAGAA